MFSLIQAAGWPVWFLIAASMAAVALIVERGLSLRAARVLPPRLLDDVLALHRNSQVSFEVIQRLEANSPLGRVLATGLRMERAPRDVMKEAVEETGRAVAHELERYLSALGTIASIAPLMGLFGTVVGMIEIFGAQAPAGTNPQQLAHGISVALYNTAFGLVIAVPAMIAYRYYRNRVDGYLVEMEQQSLRLIDTIRLAPPPVAVAARSPGADAEGALASPVAPTAAPTAAGAAPAARRGAAARDRSSTARGARQ